MRLDLPPRDLFSWFRVIETRISIGGGATVDAVQDNPDRIAVYMSANAAVNISTIQNPAADQGLSVGTGAAMLTLHHYEVGALTQIKLRASAPVLTILTVVEVILDYESHRGIDT